MNLLSTKGSHFLIILFRLKIKSWKLPDLDLNSKDFYKLVNSYNPLDPLKTKVQESERTVQD